MSKRNITVPGINDGHDAGATIIRNGKVARANSRHTRTSNLDLRKLQARRTSHRKLFDNTLI